MNDVVTITGGPGIADLAFALNRDHLLVSFDIMEIGPSVPAKIMSLEEVGGNNLYGWRIEGSLINHYSQSFYGEYNPEEGVGLFYLS